MKRITKIVCFVGIPIMAMLGCIEAIQMRNQKYSFIKPVSGFQMTMHAIAVGAATLLVVSIAVIIYYCLRYLLSSKKKKHKK